MRWTYKEKPYSELLWEVLENGRRLFLIYRAGIEGNPDKWSRFVWNGPYCGSEIRLDPFQLRVADYDPQLDDVRDPGPLPVFVCQEEELAGVVTFKSGPPTTVRIPSVSVRPEVSSVGDDEWLMVVKKQDVFRDIEIVSDISLVKLPKGVVGIHSESPA